MTVSSLSRGGADSPLLELSLSLVIAKKNAHYLNP
jgi:hypothetical protein